MDTLPPGPLILSLLLIVAFSAIITIAETATVAISDARLKKLAEDGDRRAVRLFKLLDENPSEFMDAMQFSTNFFGFLASSVASIGFVHTLVVFVESYGVSVPDGLLKSIVILQLRWL
ncbi:MAG: CNNM domain-containing protein [Oscillospiraceae bacterium]